MTGIRKIVNPKLQIYKQDLGEKKFAEEVMKEYKANDELVFKSK